MMVPVRIQLRRTRGWRMPADTAKVDRTTKWGNPYCVVKDQLRPNGDLDEHDHPVMEGPWLCHSPAPDPFIGWYFPTRAAALVKAVELFRWRFLESDDPAWASLNDQCLDALRWKNLACWCGLCPAHALGKPFNVECSDCAPCHADVIGAHANRRIRP